MTEKNNFNDYELFNVKLDVWIDDEEYGKVYEHITPSVEIVNEEFVSEFQKFLSKESHIKSIKINGGEEKDINSWQSLFWAKYLRAKIMENGTDTYMVLLDDLVLYLQRNLPYQCPNNGNEWLLQHIYLQELSACAKAGFESLGFTLQAENILRGIKDKIEKNKYELYRLWAKLNQGMGYAHSKQMMEALKAYDEIIKKFPEEFKNSDGDWRSLIYDQAVLFKAEVLEELQFSYHTLTTIKALNGRKKEHGLIKEALAYRDMCRLGKSKDRIEELWGKFKSVSEAFETYETWQGKTRKRNIKSQAFGLLIDFYLMKFEEEGSDKSLGNEVSMFIEKLKGYVNKDLPKFLKDSKKERMSFYCQIARFLNWLCKKETKQAEDLYLNFSNDIKNITLEDLKKLATYEYDKYTESLEKFYKEINKDGTKPFPFKDDEIEFLEKARNFEESINQLFKFKKLERDLRIERLQTGNRNGGNCSECFQPSPSKDRESFHGILECANNEPSDDNMKEKMLTDFYDIGMKTMGYRDYESVMKYENLQFLNHLKFKSKHPGSNGESYHFMGLQRWNSQTPALALSKGGGYFIYKKDEESKVALGIAIDPGFDFIDNLFHMGFTINALGAFHLS